MQMQGVGIMRNDEHSYRSLCHAVMSAAGVEMALDGLRMTAELAELERAGDEQGLRKLTQEINEAAMALEDAKGAKDWLEGLPDDLCPEVEEKTMADVRKTAKEAAAGLEERIAALPPDIAEAMRSLVGLTKRQEDD